MDVIILIIHLLIAIALVVVVLLQRSEGGALGIGGSGGGGGGGGMFSARGTASALTRTTAVLAVCFMCTSLGLAVLAGNRTTGGSILDNSAPAAAGAETQAPVSDEPAVPLSE